jgi:hypothetical protein
MNESLVDWGFTRRSNRTKIQPLSARFVDTERSVVQCVRKVAVHTGYGSGLYRRSWTSLPTPFISVQRLSDSTVFNSRTGSAPKFPKYRMLSSGWSTGLCRLNTSYPLAYEDGTDSVLKRWHLNYRHRWITQMKAYDIQNTVKVWNQEFPKYVQIWKFPLQSLFSYPY